MLADNLNQELRTLGNETFEVVDLADLGMDAADATTSLDMVAAASSSSCSCSSCCSCSTSSCCSCSTSTSSCG